MSSSYEPTGSTPPPFLLDLQVGQMQAPEVSAEPKTATLISSAATTSTTTESAIATSSSTSIIRPDISSSISPSASKILSSLSAIPPNPTDYALARQKVLSGMVTSLDLEREAASSSGIHKKSASHAISGSSDPQEASTEDGVNISGDSAVRGRPLRGRGSRGGRMGVAARKPGTGRPPGRPRKHPLPIGPDGLSVIETPKAVRGRGRGGRPRGRGRGRGSRGAVSVGASGSGGAVKRKRRGDESDSDDVGMTDEAEEDEDVEMEDGGSDSETMAHRTPALTTKSGRLIQAPNTFSPVVRIPQIVRRGRGRGGRLSSGLMRGAGYAGSFGSGSGSGKGGSRVPCKICTRSAGTMSNVLLNCAICHGGWHQFCHDPPVAEAFRTGGWLCGGCEAIKTTKGTGPNISTEAKRAFLKSLSKDTLLNLLLHASATHNDIPLLNPPPLEDNLPTATATTTEGEPLLLSTTVTFPIVAGKGLYDDLLPETAPTGDDLMTDDTSVAMGGITIGHGNEPFLHWIRDITAIDGSIPGISPVATAPSKAAIAIMG